MKLNTKFMAAMLCLTSLVVFGGGARGQTSDAKVRREIAVTFDDLPASGDLGTMTYITQSLLKTIADNKIPAVGFVNEGRLFARGETDRRIALLQLWLDAGLELGNHTFSHILIERNSLDAYKEDVIRGETVTRLLLRAKGMKLRYFRHTQLRTGPTVEYRAGLNKFLIERGYTIAPVTLDNQEWVFAGAYRGAKNDGDRAEMVRVGDAYLKYMDENFAFFEKLSRDFLGYEVKQTLLVHANELNADYFDDLVTLITNRGYTFISLEDALKDKAYSLPEAQSKIGLSWIHRWMLAKGLEMRPEPPEPEWIANLNKFYSRQ
ncbi:MAG TPA: polysaccharide deacetylase family protein [Pyrinomonadaceae bacterium]|nr:polysaccharide deacetylase family protein [Pyrinomonadaceae bacterium]